MGQNPPSLETQLVLQALHSLDKKHDRIWEAISDQGKEISQQGKEISQQGAQLGILTDRLTSQQKAYVSKPECEAVREKARLDRQSQRNKEQNLLVAKAGLTMTIIVAVYEIGRALLTGGKGGA